MNINFEQATLRGACGVSHVSNFHTGGRTIWTNLGNGHFGYKNIPIEKTVVPSQGGANWLTSGFVNTPECKAMYDHILKHYNLVYQTPVRLNRNSGHKFFFAVFDKKPRARKPKNPSTVEVTL